MRFDRFCGIVERHIPHLRKYAESARIFTFEEAPHKFLPDDYPDSDREFINENFFLPFRTIAVEDAASLIILHDPEPGQRGMNLPRIFIEFAEIDGTNKDVFDSKVDHRLGIDQQMIEETRCEMMAIDSEMCSIQWGYIRCHLEPGGITQTDGWVEEASMLSKSKVYSRDTKERAAANPGWEMLRRSTLSNAKVAMMEMALANLPSNFIVEITNAKAELKKRKRDAKIPRSQNRPIYILAPPKEIRRVMRLPEPGAEGGPRTPHERRAHPRTFRSEKFTKMKGKTIIIPATWVGPSASVVGNRSYKVRIDL